MVRVACLALALVVPLSISTAGAQNNGRADAKVESMTGMVRAVYTSSLTLALGDNEIRFEVVSTSSFLARGAQRNDLVYRRPKDLVYRGPKKLADFVKADDRVTIRYRESDGALNIVSLEILQQGATTQPRQR